MNCEECKISLPLLRHPSIRCWQLTCTNRVFQYVTITRKRLLNRINALPAGNVYHPVQIEAQQDVSHVRQMYLSTSMFDNANHFFVVVFSHCELNTATHHGSALTLEEERYVTRVSARTS